MIELNENGMAVWLHKENKNLFVERAYKWCDRVIMIDETDSREIVDDTPCSTFDFTDWIPMTVEQFSKIKKKFKEVYDG